MGDAAAATAVKLAPHRTRVALNTQEQFFRLVGSEVRRTIGPKLRDMAKTEGMPQWVSDWLHFLGTESGQWQSIALLGIANSALSGVLGTYINGPMEGQLNAARRQWAALGAGPPLPPGAAAEGAARRLVQRSWGENEAAASQITADRFSVLYEGALRDPEVVQTLDMLNRGLIHASDATRIFQRAGIRDEWIAPILSLRRTFLTPAEAADMVIRGILTEQAGESYAALAGMSPEDFRNLVLDTGEPPGTADMLFAYRRGIIDKARLEHGIRQGRLRNEWIDVVESLRFVPMSTADAVEGAVQGHHTVAAAHQIAEENGLRPQDFDVLYQTAGAPLSRTEMEDLVNRGEATLDEMKQALRESRLKDKYIDKALLLRRRIPPERSIVSGLSKGVFTHDEAIQRLRALGFSPADAAAFAQEAASTKTQKHKSLAESQIVELYEDKAIDHAAALKHLQTLGYDAGEGAFILELADLRRARRFQDQALTVLRTLFVHRRLTEQELLGKLDGLKLVSDHRDQLVALWKLERNATVLNLSEAQIIAALKHGVLDGHKALQLLLQMGYSQFAADVLVKTAGG